MTVFILLIQIDLPLEVPLNGNNTELYKQLMIGGMGLVSSLFIISVIGLKIINIERDKVMKTLFIKLTFDGIYEAALIGLVVLFPILVFPFSYVFSIIIFIVEISWGIIWGYTYLKYVRNCKRKIQ